MNSPLPNGEGKAKGPKLLLLASRMSRAQSLKQHGGGDAHKQLTPLNYALWTSLIPKRLLIIAK